MSTKHTTPNGGYGAQQTKGGAMELTTQVHKTKRTLRRRTLIAGIVLVCVAVITQIMSARTVAHPPEQTNNTNLLAGINGADVLSIAALFAATIALTITWVLHKEADQP